MAKTITWTFPHGAAEFPRGAHFSRGDVLDMLSNAWLPVRAIVEDDAGGRWVVKNYHEVQSGCCVRLCQCLTQPGIILLPSSVRGGADYLPRTVAKKR